MPVNAISQSDNRKQNNIMAASAGIIAGTGGAIGGYSFAPRAVKNMDELLTCDADVFCKTLDKMEKSKSREAYTQAWSLLPARGTMDSIEVRLNNAFPGDKISLKDFKKQLADKEKTVKESGRKIDAFITEITKKSGTNMSLEEYFNNIIKKGILPEDIVNLVKDDVINIIGEDGLKAPNPINEKTIEMFQSSKELADSITKQEIKMYKNLLKTEKNGVLLKKDMIESARKDMKPMIDTMLSNTTFESIKKYVPKVGQTKWAVIGGAAAALAAGLSVKMFGSRAQ